MKPLEPFLLPFFYKHAGEVSKTTHLIRDYFQIAAVGYHEILTNGRYTALTDSPDLAAYCFENNLHHDCLYLRHPDAFQSGLIFNDRLIKSKNESTTLTLGNLQLDTSNTVVMIKKNQNSVEMLYLIANTNNKHLNTLAWNHQGLLNRYLDYFKSELSHLLRLIHQENINLATLQPQHFSIPNPKNEICEQKNSQYCLLKALGYQNICDKALTLSAREKNCLALLLQGKTAKETAAQLMLSTRTVESYLEHTKAKLNCTHKVELFSIAQELQNLQLL